jgi:maltooligosyltrehalose trehalohydrolase
LPQTFERSRLDWNELARPVAQELLTWYRKIIGLKSSADTPQSLCLPVSFDAATQWLWFIRSQLCVAVNFSAQPVAIALPEGNWHLVLTSVPGTIAPNWAAYETRVYAQQL